MSLVQLHNERPVFIGGLERSGTSLMRAVIGSHPEVAIFQYDLPLWRKIFALYGHDPLSFDDAETLVHKINNLDKAASAAHIPSAEDVLRVMQEIIAENNGGHITCSVVFAAYLKAYAQIRGRKRWGLKTPTNEFFVDDIFDAFPNASFVHLVRDPRDVAVSRTSVPWANLNLSVNPLTFRDDGWMSRWEKSVSIGVDNVGKYKGQYILVRYEDLVHDTEEVVRDVCKICRLEWDPTILKMGGHPGWSNHNSFFRSDGSSNVLNFTNRYKYKFDINQIRFIESELLGKMLECGYQIYSGDGSESRFAINMMKINSIIYSPFRICKKVGSRLWWLMWKKRK